MKNLIAQYRNAGYPDKIAEKLAAKHYVPEPEEAPPVVEKKVVQMGSVKMHKADPVKKKKVTPKKK